MADAANELLQTTDSTASTAASSSQLPSKRIIQPITDVSTESKPDLNELLALEEAKEQALAAATNTAPEPEASSEPVATAIETPAATEPATTKSRADRRNSRNTCASNTRDATTSCPK
jgi:hypothetical protein